MVEIFLGAAGWLLTSLHLGLEFFWSFLHLTQTVRGMSAGSGLALWVPPFPPLEVYAQLKFV